MPTNIDRHEADFRDRMITSEALKEAIIFIANHLSPEDVFPARDLESWAREAGYVKEG